MLSEAKDRQIARSRHFYQGDEDPSLRSVWPAQLLRLKGAALHRAIVPHYRDRVVCHAIHGERSLVMVRARRVHRACRSRRHLRVTGTMRA
jgi:hypothetical protein